MMIGLSVSRRTEYRRYLIMAERRRVTVRHDPLCDSSGFVAHSVVNTRSSRVTSRWWRCIDIHLPTISGTVNFGAGIVAHHEQLTFWHPAVRLPHCPPS